MIDTPSASLHYDEAARVKMNTSAPSQREVVEFNQAEEEGQLSSVCLRVRTVKLGGSQSMWRAISHAGKFLDTEERETLGLFSSSEWRERRWKHDSGELRAPSGRRRSTPRRGWSP